MKLFHKNRNVKIDHYAPDVTITSVGYTVPHPPEGQMRAAERRMAQFLAATEPDADNASYYDRMAENEGALEKEQVLLQKPGHDGTNHSIAVKHGAELIRIRDEIEKTGELIALYSAELESLQNIYNSHNGF
ncbi:MAG TPA: hypothetical protein VN369_09155 [Terriglobales bacterium]|nr:hypothetical protein [Terriglobales bacterium]